jgi:hypothetical protein
MQVILIFLFTLMTSLAQASTCGEIKWPFSKDISKLGPTQLLVVPREHLFKYLYYEISQPDEKRIKGLAAKLFHFLKHTELNEDKYNFLEALEWASDLNTQPRVIPIREICDLEAKISRSPSSSSKKKK